MALPLEPDVQDVLADVPEPAFVPAPELEQLARHVLVRFDEFASVRAEVLGDDASLEVAYVFETAPFDEANEDLEPHTIAKVTKAGPLWRWVAGVHLVISFRRWFWERFAEEQREAVLYHEWAHVQVTGAGKVKLRQHELEEFSGVYRHFGAILPGRRGVLDAFAEYERGQRAARPSRPH